MNFISVSKYVRLLFVQIIVLIEEHVSLQTYANVILNMQVIIAYHVQIILGEITAICAQFVSMENVI